MGQASDEARGEITWVASPRSPNAPRVVYCCFWHAPGARVRHQIRQVGLAPASALSLAWHGLAWPVCGVRRVRNNNLCRRLLCTVTPPSPLGRLGMLSLPGGGLREWCLLCNYMGSGWWKGGGLRSCWGVLCCVDGTVDERSVRWQY